MDMLVVTEILFKLNRIKLIPFLIKENLQGYEIKWGNELRIFIREWILPANVSGLHEAAYT
jgi:hypothetical protein